MKDTNLKAQLSPFFIADFIYKIYFGLINLIKKLKSCPQFIKLGITHIGRFISKAAKLGNKKLEDKLLKGQRLKVQIITLQRL